MFATICLQWVRWNVTVVDVVSSVWATVRSLNHTAAVSQATLRTPSTPVAVWPTRGRCPGFYWSTTRPAKSKRSTFLRCSMTSSSRIQGVYGHRLSCTPPTGALTPSVRTNYALKTRTERRNWTELNSHTVQLVQFSYALLGIYDKKSELMLMRRARAYSSSCSQVILVYLHPFRRNSLFCSQNRQKSLKLLIFRVQGKLRSILSRPSPASACYVKQHVCAYLQPFSR